MITNPKIERVDEQIVKTKKLILKQQAKLRELERTRIALEDAEIVARFRESQLTEDDLSAISRQKASQSVQEVIRGQEYPEKNNINDGSEDANA